MHTVTKKKLDFIKIYNFCASNDTNKKFGGKKLQIVFESNLFTADGDCSHEIKRCLLPGRKVMTNLDSILRSRDITLPWDFFGRNDAKAETPVLWSPHAKS